jgi:hypothetical protein
MIITEDIEWIIEWSYYVSVIDKEVFQSPFLSGSTCRIWPRVRNRGIASVNDNFWVGASLDENIFPPKSIASIASIDRTYSGAFGACKSFNIVVILQGSGWRYLVCIELALQLVKSIVADGYESQARDVTARNELTPLVVAFEFLFSTAETWSCVAETPV